MLLEEQQILSTSPSQFFHQLLQENSSSVSELLLFLDSVMLFLR